MTMMQAVQSVYRNYVTFSGRAARSEYWWFFLFSIMVSILIGIIESSLGLGQGTVTSGDGGISANYAGGILSGLWGLGNFLPSLAVAVRRLHDTDRSGWWVLIAIVPNRFGRDPLRAADAGEVFS